MEIRPLIEKVRNGYRCSCDKACGTGSTPDQAYLNWLRRFEHRDPDRPIKYFDAVINSTNVKTEA